MSAPKSSSDPTPHPPNEQLPDIAYCITSPPPWRGTASNYTVGTRLHVVMGASYTFVPVIISIMLSGRFNDVADLVDRFTRIIRATQGAPIVASTLQMILGFSRLWRNVVRL